MKSARQYILSTLFVTLLLPSCIIRDTLRMESKLFVRIPISSPDKKPRSVEDEWIFKPVAQGVGHINKEGKVEQVQGCWFMAYRVDEPQKKHFPWLSQANAWHRAKHEIPSLADAVFKRYGVYPQVVEPNRIFKPLVFDEAETAKPPVKVADLTVHGGHNPCWPSPGRDKGRFDPLWHQEVTGMNRAREIVERSGGHGGIRVGILDNGFDQSHAAFPRHIVKEPAGSKYQHPGDTIGYLACALGNCRTSLPEQSRSDGHGTGTIGILAGSRAIITGAAKKDGSRPSVTGVIGAVPDAQIVPVRISPWVASLATANLAYGIDYASRVQGCDVISMSHGGQPSLLWMDTLNAAYDRGTVLVAAAANYMNLNTLNRGFVVPSTPLYPAACRRVLGVSGVTYSGKTYSRTDWSGLPHLLLNPKNWFLMRGCAGPDGSWQSLCSMTPMSKRIDVPQVNRSGILRAHQISAPSPSVAWLAQPLRQRNGQPTQTNLVNIDGGGTSSATPQVAGAVALWLAKNEQQIKSQGKWHSWQKAETAIQAMLLSAERRWDPAHAPEDQKPDDKNGLGAGVLRADEALKYDFNHMQHLDGKTLFFPKGEERLPGTCMIPRRVCKISFSPRMATTPNPIHTVTCLG